MKKATEKKHKDLAKKRRKVVFLKKVFSKKKRSKLEEGGQRE